MRASRGFTLVEVMVVVAIVAILAAIAVPAYGNYILRSKVRLAQSDLLAWSAVVENHRQRTLRFPADAAAARQGFAPASDDGDFRFDYAPSEGYTLTAAGAGRLAGCTLRLTANGSRSANDCPGTGSGGW
ncbi:type IV pilin protein [Coralloluteibacterium thermophilus]|uniref:Type IV pilin protein n=1 Tax=Coralloluteibacterium thermophilum TaxID=2707049 RepID=A0ABV9NJP6_9GAMM